MEYRWKASLIQGTIWIVGIAIAILLSVFLGVNVLLTVHIPGIALGLYILLGKYVYCSGYVTKNGRIRWGLFWMFSGLGGMFLKWLGM